jgi:hypothetical protein
MSAVDPTAKGWAPNGAAATGGVSVAAVGVFIWILGFWHISVPPEQAVNFCIIAAAIGTYLHPDGRSPKE